MRACVLAPVAVVVGVGSVPAHASDGPVAGLLKGAVVAPPQVGPALGPVIGLDSVRLNNALTTDKVFAKDRRAEDGSRSTAAGSGRQALRTASGDMAMGGSVAECAKVADGPVRGATGVVKRVPADALLSKVPAAPPAALRAPSPDRGKMLLLSQQLRGPLGGTTGLGASVGSSLRNSGLRPDSRAARCVPVKEVVSQAAGATNGLPAGNVAGGLPTAQRPNDWQADTLARLLGAVTNTAGVLSHQSPAVPGLGDSLHAPVTTTTKASKTSGPRSGKTSGKASGKVSGKAGGPRSGKAGRADGSLDRVAGATLPIGDGGKVVGVSAGSPVQGKGSLGGLFGGLPGLNGDLSAKGLPELPKSPRG